MVERDFYLKQLIDRRDNGRVKVITGIRRCGKSQGCQGTGTWHHEEIEHMKSSLRNFSSVSFSNSFYLSTFATALPAPCFLTRGADVGGHYIIKNAFANALFLVIRNLRNSEQPIKNIAEVDAAGWYILPPVCKRAKTLCTLWLVRIYTNGAGITLSVYW